VLKLPKLYAIVDRDTLDKRGVSVRAFAEELREGGARLVQYRDKKNGPQEVLQAAGEISEVFTDVDAVLILNDRADLAALLGWGVHVGQGDLPVEDARAVALGAIPHAFAKDAKGWATRIIGFSTHNAVQLRAADNSTADYIAIGPVFATATKRDAEEVVGLEGVRMARALTSKPLVAIGGIGLENARQVVEAGADSVAVIGALLPADGMSTQQRAQELISLLGG